MSERVREGGSACEGVVVNRQFTGDDQADCYNRVFDCFVRVPHFLD